MNNLKIYFNGIPQNLDDFNGTESASFVFRRKDEGGESAFSFAPELTVTGSAYDYIKTQIIDAPNPNIAFIDVLIYDTCCVNADGSDRLLFTGKIEGGSVRWCTFPTCEASFTVVDNSQDAEALRCLKNTFIWERAQKADGSGLSEGENTYRAAPLMDYCNDVRPGAAQEAFMIIAIIFKVVLSPLILVVLGIVALVSFVTGTSFADNNFLFTFLDNLVVGCGLRHKTPFVHSYIKNVCDICGLGLESSLFDVGGYYHDTVRMDASYLSSRDNTSFLSYELNKPNLMLNQFLDELKQFNIDWRVYNGKLIVERKDYFVGAEWFNTENLEPNQLLSICYESLEERPAAYAEYVYPKDGVDNTGSECAPRWSDKVIDWNPSNNPEQVGLFSKKLTFGSTQFRSDASRVTESPLDKPFYQVFFPVLQDNNVILMERGVSGFPRLIDVDYYLDLDLRAYRAKAKRFNNASDPNLFNYNVKWWVYENPIPQLFSTPVDTAYQKLFFIDDPRLTTVKTRKVTISITANCDLLSTLDVDKYVTTPEGQVQIEEITYDTDNNSLTIQGLI